MDWLKEALTAQEQIVADRRYLHSHAEVGFDLKDTVNYIRQRLANMGYQPRTIGKCAVVADLVGKKGGKSILLRADMDALPIQEESSEDFACQEGNMHACGHDMHAAMLLGAAKLLMNHRDQINGSVRLLFQPAEEILEGAADAIAAGVLENPKPDAAIMIHVMTASPLPTGTVIISSPGVSAPAADYFKIQVQGKGCHGSMPQQGVDALSIGAKTVTALQQIHARELPSADASVLTIGTFQAGTADNVIADTATLGGTMRAYSEESRQFLKQRLAEIPKGIAKTFRGDAEVIFGSGCPTLVNDEHLSSTAEVWMKKLLGENAISAARFGSSRSGGSEDFAYISHEVPSLMLALSAGSEKEGYIHPLHHPKVTFDERCLPVGTAVFAQCAIEFLLE